MSREITTSTIPAFNPPAYPYQDDDLSTEQKAKWSETISDWMTLEINAKDSETGEPLQGPYGPRTPLTQFFNGRVTPFNVAQKPTPISWIGFPNLVANSTHTDKERWTVADAHRDRQDEYLEWTVKKDQDKMITSVTFTCEGPEYWQFLAENDPDKMLALYKKNNPEFADKMQLKDMLDDKGDYNPYNKWNGVEETVPGNPYKLTTVNPGCIMHLAQPNNTLGAEVDIAAQGTVIRKDKDGYVITDKIGASINGLARSGNKISIADPVAIYMTQFDSSNFMLDADGTGDDLQPVPDGTFTWVRGNINKHMGLRLRVEVPQGVVGTGDNEGRQLTVSDLVDITNSQNVNYGAQFADYIHMVVNGVTIADGSAAEAEPCPCKKASSNVSALVTESFALKNSGGRRIPLKTRYYEEM
ncbi:hypothetical protein AK830_g8703 [Neonectria ditissima]|uniref:Uncharacterized protein n=1 Tax=Neonectria ditissima TaxID=78410 RepID=A0A0P7BBQ3_9HYPO|nr:hypothetical protein AK830_g8703 [Neonectria ditissima]